MIGIALTGSRRYLVDYYESLTTLDDVSPVSVSGVPDIMENRM